MGARGTQQTVLGSTIVPKKHARRLSNADLENLTNTKIEASTNTIDERDVGNSTNLTKAEVSLEELENNRF